MASAQIYTNVKAVMDALGLPGDEKGLADRCREAGAHILSAIGAFIPMIGTRTFLGEYDPSSEYGYVFTIDPLIALTAITDGNGNTVASGDYKLLPVNRAWENGPYLRIESYYDELNISGRWGLYEEWIDSGLTGTLASSSTASLSLTNGGKFWPGSVIKLEDEQCLVTAGQGGENSPSPTTATSTLANSVDETDEVLSVTNGAEFSGGEVIRVDHEDMLIRRVVTNDLIVQRGWNNTQRAAHLLAGAISVYRTVTIARGMNGTTAAAHSSVKVYEARIPSDAAALAVQIASLLRGKAQTGYTGRAGNAEQGESFWINEFPRGPINAVKKAYSWRA